MSTARKRVPVPVRFALLPNSGWPAAAAWRVVSSSSGPTFISMASVPPSVLAASASSPSALTSGWSARKAPTAETGRS